MPTVNKLKKNTTFQLTALDKEILERCYYDIDLWAKGYFDGQIFRYQRYFYHAPQRHKMLIAGIRTGKSHLASLGFLHFAQYHPYSRLLNTSISSEQAKIVFTKAVEYCSSPRFSHWVENIQTSPYPTIKLVNGSELWFRSLGYEAELIRGFEFDLINVDEAAYVTREAAYKTLKGRLLGINPLTQKPRAGIMWLISSPKGQGWLAEEWKKGDPQFPHSQPEKFLRLRATIWDNPLLDQEQIEDLMRDYTEAMIRQELYGEFLSNYDSIFPYELIMAGCDPDDIFVRGLYERIAEWNRQRERMQQRERSIRVDAGLTEDITHYECEPEAGHRYISSWDLGKKPTKNGRNAMVGMVFDITHEPWRMVAYRYAEGMGYVEVKGVIEGWHEKYSSRGATCRTVIDSTGKGDVLQEFMERERTVDDLEGIVYSGANKPNLIHAGKIMIEREGVRFPFIRRMVDQLSNYEIMDKDLAQDIVMCFCQAMYSAREMTSLSNKANQGNLQQRLNAMSYYNTQLRGQRSRMSPRYIESRMARRQARAALIGGRRRG